MKGFTLVDVLVGTSLMLIVFLGIFGAFQLGLKAISLSRSKITAIALANRRLEQARNLSYQKVGIEGIDESGALPQMDYYESAGRQYTIETDVDCRNNLADGSDDACLCDYKTVRAAVSWQGRFSGEISLATDIAPKNDIQECEKQGGVLEVKVFDAQGIGTEGVLLEVENIDTGITEQCFTDQNGQCSGERGIFLDASPVAENYKITTNKTGLSSETTYKAGDVYGDYIIANPEKPHATILQGQIIEKSFSVDQLSSFLIETKSSRGKQAFEDEFSDMSKISDYSNIDVLEGKAVLGKSNGDYFSSGYLISNHVSPASFVAWNQFCFEDQKPENTGIKYQVLYFDGFNWLLIPDQDLPGNLLGFDISPIDLSGLNPELYSQLKLKALLSTDDLSKTPCLLQWELSYFTKTDYPLAASFNLRGSKMIGTDSQEAAIYKYGQSPHSINYSGQISGLEWDQYNFSDFLWAGQSMELEETSFGEILPDNTLSAALSPDTEQSLILYFSVENNLYLEAKDSETSDPVFSANVRLYNIVLEYDEDRFTDEQGRAFFAPLEQAQYNIEIEAEGYEFYEGQILVSGDASYIADLILSPD